MSGHITQIVSRDELKVYTEQELRKLVADLDIIDPDFDPLRRGYVPPGPVAQAFITSTILTPVIMGPLGGGKTTACVFKRILHASLAPVARHPDDGKPTRMCRWIVLRDTFRSAEKTVLASWQQWFPKTYPGSTWRGGNDRPVEHVLRFRGQDGVRIEAITEFAGLNDHDIETLMKGREYSGAWANELDTHAEGALDDLEQRVGRYPMADLLLTEAEIDALSRELGRRIVSGKRLRTVIGDMNAPTIDNWTYATLVKDIGPDRFLFRQPAGRSPEAENLVNLDEDYYERIVRNQPDWFVRRMVDNKFGYSRSGKPVFDTFDDQRHVSRTRLEVKRGLTLHIGVDASTSGLSPAAMFAQAWAARIAFLRELYMGHGVGPMRFAQGLLRCINDHFPNAGDIKVWIDPAAEHGGDKEGGQLSALEILHLELGVPILIPAGGSNELSLRLPAVAQELRGHLEPNSHLIIDGEACPMFVEAMAGKYRFKKLSERASNEYEGEPEKLHPWSDLMDAGQYDILGIRGRSGIIRSGGEGRGNRQRETPWGKSGGRRKGGFDPHRF